MNYFYVGLASFIGGVVVSYIFRKREESVLSTVKADVANEIAAVEAKLASGVAVTKADISGLFSKVKSIL